MILLILGWLICGFFSYGFLFAHLRSFRPIPYWKQLHYKRHMAISILFSLGGPAVMIALGTCWLIGGRFEGFKLK